MSELSQCGQDILHEINSGCHLIWSHFGEKFYIDIFLESSHGLNVKRTALKMMYRWQCTGMMQRGAEEFTFYNQN